MRFATFLSRGFTNVAVINPPERKLAKCTSVLSVLIKGSFHSESTNGSSYLKQINQIILLDLKMAPEICLEIEGMISDSLQLLRSKL